MAVIDLSKKSREENRKKHCSYHLRIHLSFEYEKLQAMPHVQLNRRQPWPYIGFIGRRRNNFLIFALLTRNHLMLKIWWKPLMLIREVPQILYMWVCMALKFPYQVSRKSFHCQKVWLMAWDLGWLTQSEFDMRLQVNLLLFIICLDFN